MRSLALLLGRKKKKKTSPKGATIQPDTLVTKEQLSQGLSAEGKKSPLKPRMLT